MADATAQAKAQVEKSTKQKSEMVEEAYAHQGTPTPTQEENDLAKLGVPFETHADDGSGPSPQFELSVSRQSEANKPSGGGYMTRGHEATKETPQRSASGGQHSTTGREAPKQQS